MRVKGFQKEFKFKQDLSKTYRIRARETQMV